MGGGHRSDRRGRRLRVAVATFLVAGAVAIVALVSDAILRGDRGVLEVAASPSTQPSITPTGAAPTATPSAVATLTTSPTAPPPLANGRIALVDHGGALVTIDDRGGSRASHPADGIALGLPAWSPDGSRIAVVGQTADETAVYIFTVDRATGIGEEPMVAYRSAERRPFYLYWTPDGRHISFLTSEAVGLALRVAPANGNAPSAEPDGGSVIRRGAPLYFEWVGAEQVLLHVGGGSEAFTGQVRLDGTSIGEPLDATGSFRTATLSRTGRYVAYARSADDGTVEIVVQATDGSTNHGIPVFGPAAMLFDPAGESLATIAADEPSADPAPLPIGPLSLIDPASGAARTLLEDPVIAFFWAPDGRTIATLRLVDPSQAPVAAVGRLAMAAVEPAGFDLGLAFIDVASGAIRSERVVRVADGFVRQLLPYFDQYALSHRSWSPDSASILLQLVDASGRDQVVLIPVDGSDPRPIADGANGFWSP